MSVKKINFVRLFEIFFAVLIILAGIFLRWKVWQTNLSFWCDEDVLIRNSIEILIGKYPIWRGLEAEYSPPFLFALTRPIYLIFGLNEVAFRFIPFMASVLALPAMAVLSKKILKTPFLFLVPLFLVAIDENLLFYTQYYKFYSSDFLFALLISIAVFYLSFEKFSYKQAIRWGLLAGLASWSAYSAIFYLTGIFGFLFIKILFDCSKEKLLKFFCLATPFAIMTCWYYIEVVTRRTNYDYLQSAWSCVYDGRFYPHDYEDIYFLFNYLTSLDMSKSQLEILLFLMIFGVVFMFVKYKMKALYFISPCLVMLTLAFLGKYPFIERQTLFLLSMLLILVFKCCDFSDMWKKSKGWGVLSIVLMVFVASLWKIYDFKYLSDVVNDRKHFCMSTAREFYRHLENEYKFGDWIYSRGRDASLRIYDKKNMIDFFLNIEEEKGFDDFIKEVPKGSRVHIYISEYPYVKDDYVKYYDFIKKNCGIIQEIKEPMGTYVLFRR